MSKPTCHYLLIARTAFTNAETGEIEFKAVERKFENENPILAREAAFTFRNEFIYGMLTAIGLSDEEIGWNNSERKIGKLSEREIRKLINEYLEPEDESSKTTLRSDDNDETEIEWTAPDDTLSWYSSFTN